MARLQSRGTWPQCFFAVENAERLGGLVVDLLAMQTVCLMWRVATRRCRSKWLHSHLSGWKPLNKQGMTSSSSRISWHSWRRPNLSVSWWWFQILLSASAIYSFLGLWVCLVQFPILLAVSMGAHVAMGATMLGAIPIPAKSQRHRLWPMAIFFVGCSSSEALQVLISIHRSVRLCRNWSYN